MDFDPILLTIGQKYHRIKQERRGFKMKKNKRIGAIVDELVNNPNRLYDSKHFCDKYDIAKSSLSEDIKMINEILEERGSGHIESTPGVGGGIRYIPGISKESVVQLQEELIEKLEDPSRILGGGFIYTSDIMFDGYYVRNMARFIAQKFNKLGADYVVTVETKGIPLAAQVASLLDIPMVVIRREAKYSEGSTVSINYFSGSYDRIQKMSIAKRAVEPGTKAVIVDDFMRGGGSIKGIEEILAEFNIETIGSAVAMASREPAKKKISDYISILYLDSIDEEGKTIKISPNEDL